MRACDGQLGRVCWLISGDVYWTCCKLLESVVCRHELQLYHLVTSSVSPFGVLCLLYVQQMDSMGINSLRPWKNLLSF